jgi:hypothetical protein
MDCKAQEIAGGYIEKIVPLGQQRGQGNEQGERVQGKANRTVHPQARERAEATHPDVQTRKTVHAVVGPHPREVQNRCRPGIADHRGSHPSHREKDETEIGCCKQKKTCCRTRPDHAHVPYHQGRNENDKIPDRVNEAKRRNKGEKVISRQEQRERLSAPGDLGNSEIADPEISEECNPEE